MIYFVINRTNEHVKKTGNLYCAGSIHSKAEEIMKICIPYPEYTNG